MLKYDFSDETPVAGGDEHEFAVKGSGQTALAPAAAGDVPGDTTSTVVLPLSNYLTGTIDTLADHDWFRITLTAGQTYTFSTILATTLSDSTLALRDATGALILENDDAIQGGNQTWSEIVYTATASGTYYLDVGAYGDGETGEYYLTAVGPANDTIAASTATTATIAIGGLQFSRVNTLGDHDWYAVQLTAGQSYVFETSNSGGADVDTTLAVRGANGTLLGFNDDSNGAYSRVRFTAETTGTYYVDIGAWGNNATGTYQLNASVAPPLSVFTNDQIATQLTSTYWGGNTRHFAVAPGGTLTVNVTALTAEGQFLAREALNLWTDATGINFSEVASGGQIVFDDNQSGAFSTSSTNGGGTILDSHVNVSTDWLASSGTTLRSYSFQTYVHEIGHALGLGHAGDYNGNAAYPSDASYLNDAWATTIMSYFDQIDNTWFANQGFTYQYAVTPMVADIVAVANLYGVNTLTRTGDTVYGVGNNTGRAIYDAVAGQTAVTFTIIDNGGTDTVNYSGYSSNARIDLNPETFSNVGSRVGNMTIARGTVIENAITGSGTDVLIGNAANNRLDGGTGNDEFYGGLGNDTFVIDQQGELVFENPGEGTDTVESSANYYLFANIEALTLVGSAGLFGVGNALDNIITGNAGQNLLLGGAGNDTINGGDARDSIFGEDGADTINGEAGVDYLVGGIGNDTIDGGANADEIYGQDGNDTLTGGATFDTDIVVGGTGDDTIYANSGLGDYDILNGGGGNDTFYVDTPDDIIYEALNEGTDTVFAGITGAGYYLWANVENCTLTGNTPFAAGNALNNVLIGSGSGNWLLGNEGNDTLNGKGGNDVLFGDLIGGPYGNDTFVFDGVVGQDVIGDFHHGEDQIRLIGSYSSFAEVSSHFGQNGGDGVIDLGGGNLIVLQGVTMSSLTANDFIFG